MGNEENPPKPVTYEYEIFSCDSKKRGVFMR